MANITFSLNELASRCGYSPRLVRRYIEQGLLPPAQIRGRGAYYTAVHMDRLRAVGILKTRDQLRISEIRRVLDNLSGDEIRQVAAGASLSLGSLLHDTVNSVHVPPVDLNHQQQSPERAIAAADIEMWATVRITADIELRARGLNGKALDRLQAIAGQLRQVIQTNQPLVSLGAVQLPTEPDEGETRSLLTPLDDALL